MFKKLLLLASFFLLSGCLNSGMFLSLNQTVVELSEANFEVVATNVTGQAEADYLVGVSMSTGLHTQTLALIKLSGAEGLYQEALKNLWDNFKAQYGQVEGEKLALVNIRYDSEILNLILYNKVKLIVRADVVRFR